MFLMMLIILSQATLNTQIRIPDGVGVGVGVRVRVGEWVWVWRCDV
jgi:hypothetical protein